VADSGVPTGADPLGGPAADAADSVGAIAQLYLGNILYAIERCALSLEADALPLDAAFYRGIGRKLADAHGKTRT
jgi:hypothetical protein